MGKLAEKNRLLEETTSKYSLEVIKLATSQKKLTKEELGTIFAAKGLKDAELEQEIQTAYLATSQGVTQGTTNGLSAAFTGLGTSIKATTASIWAFLKTNPVGWAILAGATIGGAYKIWDMFNVSAAESAEKAREVSEAFSAATDKIKESTSFIQDVTTKYKDLKIQLSDSTQTESELYQLRSDLYDLQIDINDQYGIQAEGIDLVNGKYDEQINKLKYLNEYERKKYIVSEKKNYYEDFDFLNEKQDFSIKSNLYKNPIESLPESFEQMMEKYNIKLTKTPDVTIGTKYKSVKYGLKLENQTKEEALNDILGFSEEIRNNSEYIDNPFVDVIDGWISDFMNNKEYNFNLIPEKKSDMDFYEHLVASDSPQKLLYDELTKARDKYNKKLGEIPYLDYQTDKELEKAKTNYENIWAEWENESASASQVVKNAFADVNSTVNDDTYNFTQKLAETYGDGFHNIATKISSLNIYEDQALSGYFDNVEDVEIKGFYDELLKVAEANNLSEKSLISFLTSIGIFKSVVEDLPEATEPFDVTSLDLNGQTSDIESAYSSITNAMKEYNDQGYLNMSTIDSLIALDDAYINQLIDENGNIQYNAEAFNGLAISKLEEAKAEIYRQALARIGTLVNQEQEKSTLNEAIAHDTLSESLKNEAQARLNKLKNTENIDLANDIMNASDIKAALIDEQIANLTSGTYKYNKAVGSTKDTVQDFTQVLDAELNLLDTKMNHGLLKFTDYISQRKTLIQKYYAENKIDADKYYDYLKQHYEKQLSDMDRVTSAVTRRFDKEIDSINKVIEGIEAQNESLEEQIEIMESAIDAVVDYYEELIQTQENLIDETEKRNDVMAQEVESYDTLLNVVERVYSKEQDRLLEQQDILQQRIDALNDESSAYDLLYRKEQALYALRQAQNQRTKKVYTAGKGYTYETDELAIRDAEKNLADINTEEIVNQLEKEKNALQESIDSLDEWKNKWAEISDSYQKTVEERIAADLLGEDYESRILSNNQNDIDYYKNKYFTANQEIDDNIKFIEASNDKIQYYEDLKNQWSNLINDLAKEKDKQNAAQIFGPDWEQKILEGSFTDFTIFKDSYKNIQNQINDNTALIESYNEKIQYYQNLKDQWSAITTAYEESVDDQYAAQILGQNWEADILSGRLDSLNNFKNEYIAIQQAIADAALESANIQKEAEQEVQKGSSANAQNSANTNTPPSSPTDPPAYEIRKYAKGGVITSADGNPLDLLAHSLGEDHIIAAKDGERILTHDQNNLWEQWTKSIPNLQNLNDLLPKVNATNNLAMREQTVNVTQQVSINCPNVTDKSGAEYISRALNKTYLDSMQYKHRR